MRESSGHPFHFSGYQQLADTEPRLLRRYGPKPLPLIRDHPRSLVRCEIRFVVRRREALVGVRLTAEEYAAVKAAAEEQQRSPGSVLRAAFFDDKETAN